LLPEEAVMGLGEALADDPEEVTAEPEPVPTGVAGPVAGAVLLTYTGALAGAPVETAAEQVLQ